MDRPPWRRTTSCRTEAFPSCRTWSRTPAASVSYFEWVQDLQNFFWTEQEVNERLTSMVRRAFQQVLATAEERKVDLRTAALMRGIRRIAEAKRRRGIFP